MTSVLVINDQRLVRDAVRAICAESDAQVIAEAEEAVDGARLAAGLGPDVVVVSDLTAVEAVAAHAPDTRIVLIGAEGSVERAAAMRAGAAAVLGPQDGAGELLGAVTQHTAPVLLRIVPMQADRGPLTRREHEVLQQLAAGRTSQEIAEELFISLKTVKNHLGSIYAKLEAHNRTQAVLSGMRLGLVRIAS